MFENSSILVLTVGNHPNNIYRLDVDADTQKAISTSFEHGLSELVKDKTKTPFDGSYKPEEYEFLFIGNFRLSDPLKDAIRDPIGVPTYQEQNGSFREIKAICVGERNEDNDTEQFKVAFQRFRKEQYISTNWINLFFTKSTFRRETDFGISISNSIDCYFTDGELQFSSFYFARQIFDLSEYYRTATDKELSAFTKNEMLAFEDTTEFMKANSWIRRKVAMINDSEVLKKHNLDEIQKYAQEAGILLKMNNNKIVIPSDKEQIRIILGFFDEEAYKGPFSQDTFLANSKRKISK